MRKRAYERANESVRGIHERAGKRGAEKSEGKVAIFLTEIWCREGVAQVSFGVVSPSVSDAATLRQREPIDRKKLESLPLMREVARLVRDGGREGIWRCIWLSPYMHRHISPSVGFTATLRQREPMI